jgi:hypothetical protein
VLRALGTAAQHRIAAFRGPKKERDAAHEAHSLALSIVCEFADRLTTRPAGEESR